MDHIIDRLDIAAKDYPIKALADEIDKGESTMRNELTQQPGYKLGLKTAVLIMEKTGDLSALDLIEEKFGRVAFRIPAGKLGTQMPIMQFVSNVSKEFGESVQELGKSLDDGDLSKKEIKRCIKENKDLIKACVELDAYLETLT